MKGTNFGVVAESYSRSRNDIPHSLFESLQLRNIIFEGKKIADIGCGTGALTRKLSLRNGNVIGIDPSRELIAEAQMISQNEFQRIDYQLGTAEQTGFEATTFDIVTVMRAWHWFDRDVAIQEFKRILKPKGILLVIDSGFTGESLTVVQTFTTMSKYVPEGIKPAGSKADSKQRINGFPVEWFEEWRQHELDLRDFYKLDYTVSFTNEEWVDRVGSLSWMTNLDEEKRQLAKFDLLETLKETYGPNAVHQIPHNCTVAILTN